MILSPPSPCRELKTERLACDLAVVGGGLAGACCAITAARAGLKVVLLQDRPVLGGNASSEVRLWVLGATSHLGNNNRWAREGGVVDELLVENLYRNPEGNPLILDALLLEMVVKESNLTLLLNTAVYGLEKFSEETIQSVRAFCAQNSTTYEVAAPLFVDASGDGIVGFLAGAAFRIGAESREEFGEAFAPAQASRDLLGHTLYFYSKNSGRPVKFLAPSFALKDITQIPRWRDIRGQDSGCRFWWLEWGGQLDTVHDTEQIKWELWKVVYGVWDYIKNSGRFPEAETMTLEWVGTIPGKRESRRFEGGYMLRQQDLVEQRRHPDAVSFGGWAIDLHPVDGVYSEQPGCTQWHTKGVYQIPYRTMYSRNIGNLFLTGRLISASHVAFGSTRVMATCAHNGQAVGMAAALCRRHGVRPRELLAPARMVELQRELLCAGQYIPGVGLEDSRDLARKASLSASSELCLGALQPSGEILELENSVAMMLPVQPGPMPRLEFLVDAARPTTLRAELRVSSKADNHTPDVTLSVLEVPLPGGKRQAVRLSFSATIDTPRYAFVCLMANEALAVHLSEQRLSGVLSLTQKFSRHVANSPRQEPPPNSGLESFEFWLPQRRPAGKNLALTIDPPLLCFGVQNLVNGISRPTNQPNAWVADFAHEQPVLRLSWPEPQTLGRIELAFDTDFDHPMESVQMGHPERVMPFCVRNVVAVVPLQVPVTVTMARNSSRSTLDEPNGSATEQVLFELTENHQSRQVVRLKQPVTTDCLELRLVAPSVNVPAALFQISCFAPSALLGLALFLLMFVVADGQAGPPVPGYRLVWADEFDAGATALDANWEFQNGPSGHILCSRWRENVVVSNGIARFLNRKEQRGGQEWTSGSCWSRRQFKYGYFECRYRYGVATGLNNSFWLMDRLPKGAPGKFEIDINEGHYPNEVAMNIHRWSGQHISNSKKWNAVGRNLANEFHTYGLLWTERELVWFFEGREIRRETNAFCHSETPVWLSSAIIKWAGKVTDQIDGTAMEVDYVRVYQPQGGTAQAQASPLEYDFNAMLQPVPLTAKWVDTNYNVWCGSAIKGDDGKYHLFYSRWPRKLGHVAWVTHSEVAHAVSDSPFGPWTHHDVALPARGTNFWDGSCTHNPTVLRISGKYYLYYMGNYGDGVVKTPLNWAHRNRQRIGVAVADNPDGPWQRFDQPVLDVSPDTNAPDGLLTSNPSVAVRPDGGVLMIYKAVGKKRPAPFGGPVVHLVATSDSPTGPFKKHPGEVFGAKGVMFAAEDPFIWRGTDRYWAVVKDNEGHFTQRGYSLALWESADGFDWKLAQHPFVANPGTIRWADGHEEKLQALERPQLVFENAEPVALCCAAANDKARVGSFNLQIPLKSSKNQ